MPIVERKVFEIAPEGTWQAVCVDVGEPFVPKNSDNGKEVVRITWIIGDGREDGLGHEVSALYSLTLHEKSKLYGMLNSWLGGPPPRRFELDELIGRNCYVTVARKVAGEKTYANVVDVQPIDELTERLPVPASYVRGKDRVG